VSADWTSSQKDILSINRHQEDEECGPTESRVSSSHKKRVVRGSRVGRLTSGYDYTQYEETPVASKPAFQMNEREEKIKQFT
jgi:hypothetical protein